MKITKKEIDDIYKKCGLTNKRGDDVSKEPINFDLPNKLYENKDLTINTNFLKSIKLL